MQVVIGIFLFGLGIAALLGGHRVYRSLMSRAAQISQPEPETPIEEIEVTGDVADDGLVYLFGHEFVREKPQRTMSISRDRAHAPLVEVELDPEDWALQILYATLCRLHEDACIQWRAVERAPTFLPPFPQKSWELEIIQRTPFPPSPVMDAIDVAFDLMRKRKQQRVAQGKEEPGEVWAALDEIIERALRAMRQEISFWERSGVCGDLRNYVAAALVAQGYLLQPGKETWLDRTRSKRPKPNLEAVDTMRPAMEQLTDRLRRFRLKHGSPHARGEVESEDPQEPVPGVDPTLASEEQDLDDLPFDDCLRISIYETIIGLKQLEPSADGGI